MRVNSLNSLRFVLSTCFIANLITFSTAKGADIAKPLSLFCQQDLEGAPVQAGGRVKPFYVLAKETVKFMTYNKKPLGMSPVAFFCHLSLDFLRPEAQRSDLALKVDHLDVKKFIGMPEDQKSYSAMKLIPMFTDIQNEYRSIKLNNSYKKELNRVLQRIQVFQSIAQGVTWTIPIENDQAKKANTEYSEPGKQPEQSFGYAEPEQDFQWVPLHQIISDNGLNSDWKNRIPAAVTTVKQYWDQYIQKQGDGHLTELNYFKWRLYSWAMLFILIAVFALVLSKKNTIAITFTGIALLVQTMAVIMRIFISGRAPITNMYETVMFSGFGALLIGIYLMYRSKQKSFLMGGLCYNFLCLLMMTFANNMLNPSISPLVPVLRDNFWLSTHVTTIILSYAALALSWVIANITMIKETFGTIDRAEYNKNVQTTYSCIKVGVVLLAAGIILGGVWADYSWGRFWGWDPKETWSLIVLLFYMAILHGRYSSWISPQRFIPFVALAFMSVMMAWFGVNYILASGLHSYGFSEGGAVFLGSFFAVQTAVYFIHLFRKKLIPNK